MFVKFRGYAILAKPSLSSSPFHNMTQKSTNMMNPSILNQYLVLVFVLTMCPYSFAGQYDDLIYFVNHRDANGNLVVPQGQKSSQMDFVPDVESTTSSQATSQTPMTPQPVSHVTPVTEFQEREVPQDSQHDMEMPQASELGENSNDERPDVIHKMAMPNPAKRYAFGHANWGMSVPEVKTKETADFSWELNAPVLLAGEHRLGYQTQVEGIDTFLAYTFEHDHLKSTKYLFETGYAENEAQSLSHYKTVKAWIMQTYGSPHAEGTLWVNELYRYAPELWGRALMRGHLTFVDEWDVDGTTITLVLNGGDEAVGLMAEFMTKNLSRPRELVSLPSSDVLF